jgi:hypothetical protein
MSPADALLEYATLVQQANDHEAAGRWAQAAAAWDMARLHARGRHRQRTAAGRAAAARVRAGAK